MDVLKIVSAAALIAFAFFCAYWAVYVWRKRNKSTTKRSPVRTFGSVVTILGVFGATAVWGALELETRAGIVDGADLFVIRAKRDAVFRQIVESAEVEKGQAVAEFIPPALETQLAVADSRIRETEAHLRALASRPLGIDPLLVQRHAQLRSELDQYRQLNFDLERSIREYRKDHLALLTAWTEKQGQVEGEMKAARNGAEVSSQQVKVAQQALERAQTMARTGVATTNMIDDRSVKILSDTQIRNQHEIAAKEAERRLVLLNSRYSDGDRYFRTEIEKLGGMLLQTAQHISKLQTDVIAAEKAIAADRERARFLTEREIEAGRHQLEALKGERDRTIESTLVKAPVSGQVVYSHPAPGSASDNAPVMAISTGTGFTAKVWMPTSEVAEIERAGTVKFGLETAVLIKFFTGKFKKVEEAPFESNRMIVHMDVNLPMEIISKVATDPLKVKLLWTPSLISLMSFRVCLAAVLLGTLIYLLGGMSFRRSQRAISGVHGSNVAPHQDRLELVVHNNKQQTPLPLAA